MNSAPWKSIIVSACFWLSACSWGSAQWDPVNGQWGKQVSTDIRVMTWNVEDGICSTNQKTESLDNWTALVVIVAAFKPDVLILQECGDNDGNGTGSGVDSIQTLETVMDLFLRGGNDPFRGGQVTAYVQKYAPGYDLPYIFVSGNTDGFNRNIIASRFPFADLNGDTRSWRNDTPFILSDEYNPGGDGGIRGFQHAELDLPDNQYLGDLVIGNSHLKAGSSSNDKEQRLEASQVIAYFIDYLYGGAGTGIPDPNSKILDNPPATQILSPTTPVIWGGDWNEDELLNGRKGPADWVTLAEFHQNTFSDGTDRDGSDAMYDAAVDLFDDDPQDRRATRGTSKLDYIGYQNSIATSRLEFIFRSNTVENGGGTLPPELNAYPAPVLASSFASDHRPVIVDFQLPLRRVFYFSDAATNLDPPPNP